ncbi:hypothetical protein RB195_024359 [Necator americanus]|uniref:Reverse transcriptase domain-containing protein n=1 Tax=Necator americanus TaxID=51031 RepID=A0ABR1EMU3_NECAM
MHLAFLEFEAAFDSPHRGRLLNALRADGVPGKFVRLLDDMNERTTAAVRTPVGYATPFEPGSGYGVPADDTCKISTSCTAIENSYRKSSSLLWPYIKGTSRSPWSTSVEEFIGLKLEKLAEDESSELRRDVKFRVIWNNDEWIHFVQALAEDRKDWAEPCSRTTQLDEDAGNRVSRCHQPAE